MVSILKQKSAAKPANPFSMWKTKIGGKDKGLPLDLGVSLAGILAHSIAPNEWGGRMGKSLASLGGSIYEKRKQYELESPERKMRLRLGEAQAITAERDPLATYREKRKLTEPDRLLEAELKREQINAAKRSGLMKGESGAMVEKTSGAKFFKTKKATPGAFEQFGHGQLRNKETGEIIKVPTSSTQKELTGVQKITYRKDRLKYVNERMKEFLESPDTSLDISEESKKIKRNQLMAEYDKSVLTQGSNDGVVSIKRNPKTGEIVHLDANNKVVKRIKDGKTYYKIRQ